MRRHVAAFALAVALAAGAAPAAAVTLTESGSTVLEPLFRIWARDYASVHPDVTLTVAGTSSRRGIDDALAGTVQIGASDTYRTDAEARGRPGFVDIALATSAVAVIANVPELGTPLKLDGPTLAAIYRGAVRFRDDQAIAELNPDVALPHRAIVPLRRDEGAGETVAFAQYLATAPSEDDYGTLELPNGSSGDRSEDFWSEKGNLRTGVALPESDDARVARDDANMIETAARTPYAIGYVAYPLVAQARRARLAVVALRNHEDEFLLPDVTSINRAAAALTLRTPVDERLSLVDAPGTGCYPIITYAYAVVATRQRSEAEALALRDFLNWAIGRDVASFERIEAAGLVALRSSTWLASLTQIDQIR